MPDLPDPEPLKLDPSTHCLHDPQFKAGPYFCERPRGHRGAHSYVPDYLATIAPAAEPGSGA